MGTSVMVIIKLSRVTTNAVTPFPESIYEQGDQVLVWLRSFYQTELVNGWGRLR